MNRKIPGYTRSLMSSLARSCQICIWEWPLCKVFSSHRKREGKTQTFLEGMNKDAAGLGRGGGLSFFFGRGSWGGAGKPSDFWIGCPFACGGGDGGGGFPVLVSDVVEMAVPFVPCSDNELVEAARFIGSFIPSLGLISSGT